MSLNTNAFKRAVLENHRDCFLTDIIDDDAPAPATIGPTDHITADEDQTTPMYVPVKTAIQHGHRRPAMQ